MSIFKDNVNSVEARLDILNAIHMYMDAANRRDDEGFGKLFTQDGVLAFFLEDGTERIRAEGRADIVAVGHQNAEADNTHDTPPGRFGARHYAMNTVFLELKPETARTRTNFIVTKLDFPKATPEEIAANPRVALAQSDFRNTGVYETWWKKTKEGWLISRREIHFDSV